MRASTRPKPSEGNLSSGVSEKGKRGFAACVCSSATMVSMRQLLISAATSRCFESVQFWDEVWVFTRAIGSAIGRLWINHSQKQSFDESQLATFCRSFVVAQSNPFWSWLDQSWLFAFGQVLCPLI